MATSIIGLIPARAGSQRIKNKNLSLCCGKPLLQWTVEAAQSSNRLSRIILSTDSHKIEKLGRMLGVEVPFVRPSHLGRADSPMVPVMQHALDWLEGTSSEVDGLVLLQPTSPLRQGYQIDEAIDLFLNTGSETVVSVMEVPHIYAPDTMHQIKDDKLIPYLDESTNKQDSTMDRVFVRNGPAILINKPSVIKRGDKLGDPLIPYLMSRDTSVDIDEPLDLTLAECLLKSKRGLDKGA